MRKETITMVVSIYNMERFLERSLQTFINQSNSNFEILLIDDGSTDRSAEICKKYAELYPNLVKYFYKENGGLCSARNYGILKATSEWITFPDPDDWVSDDYLLRFTEMVNNEIDLAVTSFFPVISEQKYLPKHNTQSNILILTPEEAEYKMLMDSSLGGFAWNKLYRVSIIRKHNIKFKEDSGLIEDRVFLTEYLKYSRKVSIGESFKTYYYFQHPGCATNSGFSLKRILSVRALENLKVTTKKRKIRDCFSTLSCSESLNTLYSLSLVNDSDNKIHYEYLISVIRMNLVSYLKNPTVGNGRKIQALAAALLPKTYCLLKKRLRDSA